MREGYSVTVSKLGEPILTIERTMLSGQPEFSKEDEAAIRECAEHLLAFIGPDKFHCFMCGGVEGHLDDCALILTS